MVLLLSLRLFAVPSGVLPRTREGNESAALRAPNDVIDECKQAAIRSIIIRGGTYTCTRP